MKCIEKDEQEIADENIIVDRWSKCNLKKVMAVAFAVALDYHCQQRSSSGNKLNLCYMWILEANTYAECEASERLLIDGETVTMVADTGETGRSVKNNGWSTLSWDFRRRYRATQQSIILVQIYSWKLCICTYVCVEHMKLYSSLTVYGPVVSLCSPVQSANPRWNRNGREKYEQQNH